MTYSYIAPGDSDKDTVRFYLQDNRVNEWILSDEEIQFTIDLYEEQYGDHLEYVAAILADTIAARYAREASYSADGVSIGLGQVAQQFRDLAAHLRAQYRDLLVGGYPDVGGITPGEGLTPGVKNYSFGTGMHDDLSAGTQDMGSQEPYYPIEEYPGQ